MTAATRFGPEEWETTGRPPLNQVFKNLVNDEPFQDHVPARLILDVDGFWLDERQFDAVCSAAQADGDDKLYYSVARGYLGGPELIAYYSWELPLFDYDAYSNADQVPCPKEHDIGIPLDRVLYSPRGRWGILLPDEYAVVGGSIAFVERFKENYPPWREELATFVKEFEEASRERNANVSWVPILLRHMYGDDAPEFAP